MIGYLVGDLANTIISHTDFVNGGYTSVHTPEFLRKDAFRCGVRAAWFEPIRKLGTA